MSADRVVVDTNVLLAATEPERPLHRHALTVLDEWPNRGHRLCVSGQILREYLAVATRPAEANGLALGVPMALANVAAVTGRMRLLEETERVALRLQALVRSTQCTGRRIHDANVVATARVHGVARIVTANVRHFQLFSTEIQVTDLATVA